MKALFKSFLSLLLVLTTLLQVSVVRAGATGEAYKQVEYIKEIKIFSEKDVGTAKNLGYTVVEADLNKDTAGDEVYLAYKTTNDPNEAIYDLKLMNMSGGYQFTNIEELFENQGDSMATVTEWFSELLKSYRKAYKNGFDMARNVYPVLNLFRMDEDDPDSGIGKCIVDDDVSTEEILKILLLCNSTYIDTLIKLLVTGLENNYTWLDELSKLGPYKTSKDYTSLTSYVSTGEELEVAAENLLTILKQHSAIYNLMEKTGLFAEEEYDDEGNLIQKEYYVPTAEESEILHYCMGLEGYYESAFDILETYPYGENSNLKEFFCSLEKLSDTRVYQIYPILAVLTPGQYAALYFGCVPELILNSLIVPNEIASGDDLTANEFNEVYTSMIKDIKEEYNVEYLCIYDGVDDALMNEDTTIAFTEEAERYKAETGEMDYFENNLEREDDFTYNLRFTAFVGMCCIGILSVAKAAAGIVTISIGAKALATLATTAGYKGTFSSILIFLSGMKGIFVTLAVVAIVFIYSVCCYISDYFDENYPDWDEYPIPDYIYDITDTSSHVPVYNVYEAVKQNGTDKPADLNTFDGKQWLVLYASYDNVDGTRSPITAGEMKVTVGNGETPEGYVPLCEFGEVVAKDLNAYDRSVGTNGLYLFYQQDELVRVDSTKTYYIREVYMQTGRGDTECITKLQNAGYTPINYNLTPYYAEYGTFEGRNIYTYLGYKVTTVESAAVRDMRFCYDYNASTYYHGDTTYGEHGKSGKMTLYISKMQETGTPILADGLLIQKSNVPVPEGYEPVNLFTGGPAVSINHSESYLNIFGIDDIHIYFKPKITFTEGPDFLSGIAYFDDDRYTLAEGVKPADLWHYTKQEVMAGLEYWLGSDAKLEDYDTLLEILQLIFPKRLGYQHMYMMSKPGENLEYFMCSTTKNPYRAIYDVVGTSTENPGVNIVYGNQGYSTMVTYHTYVDPDQDVYITVNSASDKCLVDSRFMTLGNIKGNYYVNTENTEAPEGDLDNYSETGKLMSIKEPILASEVYLLFDEEEKTVPEGYRAVTDIYLSENSIVTVKAKNTEKFVRMYLNKAEKQRMPYISKIYAVDYASMYRQYVKSAPGFKAEMLTRANALSALAIQGAMYFCSEDLYMPKGDFGAQETVLNGVVGPGNVVNFGYTRTDKSNQALRDLVVVCEGLSAGDPEKTIYKDGYKYSLQCEVGAFNYTGLEDNYTPRIYIYGSTDIRLGEPITEFFVDRNLFVNGYDTAYTVNGKDILSDIRDQVYQGAASRSDDTWYLCSAWLRNFGSGYSDAAMFVHFRSGDSSILDQKPFISELSAETCRQIYFRDDRPMSYDKLMYMPYETAPSVAIRTKADGYFRVSSNDIIIYKRTDKASEAITDVIFSTEKKDTLTINDITYRLAGSMSKRSDLPIYLYYTKDAAAGSPISFLEADLSMHRKSTDDINYEYVCIEETTTAGKVWLADDLFTPRYLAIGRCKTVEDGEIKTRKVFKNPSSETRISFTGTEKGKYISGIFIMDKNTIRQEKLAQGIASNKCKCSSITKDEVVDRLKEMGATYVLDNYIEAEGGNRIYIGITRTDSKLKALKDVVLYTELLTSKEPMERLSIDRKTYYLVAEKETDGNRPKAINLISGEDEQDSPGPSVYMYASRTAGEYLYELKLDNNPIVNDTKTVLSQNDRDIFEDLASQANDYNKRIEASPHFFDKKYTFLWKYITIEEYIMEYNEDVFDTYHPKKNNIKTWYLHTKNYDADTLADVYPYIGELFLSYGNTKKEALASMLKNEIDGFIDLDVNQDAGGDHVYIGYKRCANGARDPAITDVVVCKGKNPAEIRNIKKADTGVTAEYYLVSRVDLNKDAGGDYLYLYTTTDEKAGDPLTDLYISEGKGKTVDKIEGNTIHSTVLEGGSTTKVDLNEGAGGDYLYLIQVRFARQETDEERYIGQIYIAYGDSAKDAMEELSKHNVDVQIPINLNQDAGGDHVYIGYTYCANTADDPAITDLVICQGKNPTSVKSITKKDTGVTATYQLVANVDLNKDAGGKYLYLYATRDSAAGEPLTGLYISVGKKKTVDKTENGQVYSTVVREDTDEKIDLNKRAGGDYLYLIQVRGFYDEDDTSVSQEPNNLVGSVFSTPTVGIIIMAVAAIGVMLAILIVRKRRKGEQ